MKRYLAIIGISSTLCFNISYAQSQRASNEWAQLSNDERLCFNINLKSNKTSVEQLAQSNVSPNDQRLMNVKQTCSAFLNQNFKTNYQCDFNINGNVIKTLCDEAYAIQGPNGAQRLTVEQALNASAQGKAISRGFFERADALQARQNGSTSVNSETTAKNRAAEEETRKLERKNYEEELAAWEKEAEKYEKDETILSMKFSTLFTCTDETKGGNELTQADFLFRTHDAQGSTAMIRAASTMSTRKYIYCSPMIEQVSSYSVLKSKYNHRNGNSIFYVVRTTPNTIVGVVGN